MTKLNLEILQEISDSHHLDESDIAQIIVDAKKLAEVFGINMQTIAEIIIGYWVKEQILKVPTQADTLRMGPKDSSLKKLLQLIAERVENPHPLWTTGAQVSDNIIQFNFYDGSIVLTIESALHINKPTV